MGTTERMKLYMKSGNVIEFIVSDWKFENTDDRIVGIVVEQPKLGMPRLLVKTLDLSQIEAVTVEPHTG